MEKIFEMENPDEGKAQLAQIFHEFDEYFKKGKNVFDWLCDQSEEFLRNCTTENENESEEKIGRLHILIMVVGKSYMIQNDEDAFPQDVLHDLVNGFCALAAFAQFKKLGWLQVKYKAKWMDPKTEIGFKLTEKGKKAEMYRMLRDAN